MFSVSRAGVHVDPIVAGEDSRPAKIGSAIYA